MALLARVVLSQTLIAERLRLAHQAISIYPRTVHHITSEFCCHKIRWLVFACAVANANLDIKSLEKQKASVLQGKGKVPLQACYFGHGHRIRFWGIWQRQLLLNTQKQQVWSCTEISHSYRASDCPRCVSAWPCMLFSCSADVNPADLSLHMQWIIKPSFQWRMTSQRPWEVSIDPHKHSDLDREV